MRRIIKPVLALCLFFFMGISNGFEQCHSVDTAHEIRELYNSYCLEYIKKLQNGETIDVNEKEIGRGSYGVVIECALDTRNITPRVAMKITEYYKDQNDKKEKGITNVNKAYAEEIEQELNVLEAIKDADQIYIPKYYGCVHDESINTVYIFQERLDQTLGQYFAQLKPYNKKASFPSLDDKNFETTVGIMLQMAIAVKIIHKKGFGHFDLKLDNFMVLKGKNLIAKPIDFGLSSPLDGKGNDKSLEPRGSLNYVDPLWMNKQHSASSQNDVYSLGITYMSMLYGYPYVNLELKAPTTIDKYNEQAEKRDAINVSFLEKPIELNEKPGLFEPQGYPKSELITMVNKQIKRVFDSVNRPTLDDLIETFILVLRMWNAKSIYLPENKERLYDSVYNNDKIEEKGSNRLGMIKNKISKAIFSRFASKKQAQEDKQPPSLKKGNESVKQANKTLFKADKRLI